MISEHQRQYLKEYKKRSYVKAKRKEDKKSSRATQTARKRKAKQRENLQDEYIKHLIVKNTSLSYPDIPQELIEIKRLQLKIIRELKKQCGKM